MSVLIDLFRSDSGFSAYYTDQALSDTLHNAAYRYVLYTPPEYLGKPLPQTFKYSGVFRDHPEYWPLYLAEFGMPNSRYSGIENSTARPTSDEYVYTPKPSGLPPILVKPAAPPIENMQRPLPSAPIVTAQPVAPSYEQNQPQYVNAQSAQLDPFDPFAQSEQHEKNYLGPVLMLLSLFLFN